MMGRIRSPFRRFRKDEKGLASIEFALFFPIYLGMFFWAAELGIIQIKSVMLDHALDVVIRDLRLGKIAEPSQEQMREDICSRLTILRDCEENLMIELQPVSTQAWLMPPAEVTCIDKDEEMQPVTTFDPGTEQELMLVRVCANVPVIFPNMMFGRLLTKDSEHGINVAATSAFVNEPS